MKSFLANNGGIILVCVCFDPHRCSLYLSLSLQPRSSPVSGSHSLTHSLSLSLPPEDVLSKDAGECAICLEELVQGDTIARLPCLCIYHKGCIDEWFEVNRSCPEHPSD
ncbi:unnamed protein product [Oncorhynchus mykiss]|uniref:E3 ubiquitin-protein ligase ZNRF1 n=1 Tax=Oncorhynchus mykiss TaxID=8022 RepID=A0A060XFI4_ONCMY|nr:unnamed protein product [Oncorhynchus mykiss]